jgi:hypothetical protein
MRNARESEIGRGFQSDTSKVEGVDEFSVELSVEHP